MLQSLAPPAELANNELEESGVLDATTKYSETSSTYAETAVTCCSFESDWESFFLRKPPEKQTTVLSEVSVKKRSDGLR